MNDKIVCAIKINRCHVVNGREPTRGHKIQASSAMTAHFVWQFYESFPGPQIPHLYKGKR